MKRTFAATMTLCLSLSAASAWADAAPDLSVLHLSVPRIAAPLVVDGDLGKPEWQQAAVILDLTQNSPNTGAPTPYHTEVRLLRDDGHLYIGVHAVDPHPEDIVLHSLRRDADQGSDDHLTVVINTFDDHRNAYVFRINAGGGRDDGVDANGLDSPDFGWDGIWEAKTRRVPGGWDAEIAFSTRSLQFRPNSDQWGFNISRVVPRANLVAKWAAVNIDYSSLNPQHYGILDGMEGLQQGSGLEFTPYLLARSDQTDPGAKRAEVGGELKYSLTPQLSGTLTVNTDFAETEVDAQQLNLTQFALFLPEKRGFFLDGKSRFAFNNGAMQGNLNGGFIPFYSRTVGLDASGKTVPIDEGVKVIGQSDGLSIGFLDVDTGANAATPPEKLGVGRLAYNFNDQLQVGTLFTHGDPTGRTDPSFTGADLLWQTANFFGSHAFTASAWDANTSGATTGTDTRGWGWELRYPNYRWYADAQVNVYGDAFNTPLGFLPRPGTKQYWEELGYFPSPPQPAAIDYYQFDEQFNQIDDLAGHLQSYQLNLAPGWYYVGGGGVYFHYMPEYEALSAPFAVDPNVTIPTGVYKFNRYRVEYDSPQSKDFTAVLRSTAGEFYSGNAVDNYAQFNWADLGGHLELGVTNESVFGHLAQGHFVQRLWQLNVAYSFTPDLSLSTFAQYASSSDQLGFNTRLHWSITPDKDLFVVWNRNWRQSVLATPGVPDVADTLVVKLAWTFN